ncbi:MAG: glycolate oxidase subunit GlcE [Betaproteobacteria bacterium]
MTLAEFQDRIRAAASRGIGLRLRGGGSKDFYGNAPRGAVLDTRACAGIVSYEPTELVVTARCGTPLAELEKALDEQRQFLPFEPPHYGAGATLGGCVASGLSGPRRAAAGALRDYVLGVKIMDGRARELGFGGRVMKNVAGYDVSRLMAGSLGTLGVILEASLKVLPRPPLELTLRQEAPQAQALEQMNAWAGQPLPVSATAWLDDELIVRLSGAEAAVRAAARRIDGEALPADTAQGFWLGLREQTDAFFAGDEALWRIALPPSTPPLELAGRQLVEWRGGLRWLKSDAPAERVREAAARAGGHATLFRAPSKPVNAFDALDAVNMRLHRELKKTFDPAGILNPGRMYADL